MVPTVIMIRVINALFVLAKLTAIEWLDSDNCYGNLNFSALT